jgi:hypothetical protein
MAEYLWRHRDPKKIKKRGAMIKFARLCSVLVVSALLTPYQTVGSELTEVERAESAQVALAVPIADLHDHDGYAASLGKRTGVVWAGLGAKGGRYKWMSLKKKFGDKRIAWAGQGEINKVYLSGGIDEMLNSDNSLLVELYEQSEKDL